MNKKQWLSWGVMLVVCIVVFLCVETLISAVPFIKNLLDRLNLDGGMELFFAQTSLTFISISVLSMLSEKSIVIYWEDQIERKLINPLFGSFLSMTGYSFILLLFSFLSIIFVDGKDSYALALVYFLINIFVLCKLTFDMIGLYFNRNERMKQLQKVFRELYYKDTAQTAEYDYIDKDWWRLVTRMKEYELEEDVTLEELSRISKRVKRTSEKMENSVNELNQLLRYRRKEKEPLDETENGVDYTKLCMKYNSIVEGLRKKSKGVKEENRLYRELLGCFEKEFSTIHSNLERCLKVDGSKRKYRRQRTTIVLGVDDVQKKFADSEYDSLTEFEMCKLELVQRTILYMQDGSSRELKENLHMLFMFFRFLKRKDLEQIVNNTPEILKELVYRELFYKLMDYRDFFGKEKYWEIIFGHFSEQFTVLPCFLDDVTAEMLEKKRNAGIYKRTILQQYVYDMLQCATMILDGGLPKTYMKIINTAEWNRYVVGFNLEKELFIDVYRYLYSCDSVLRLRPKLDVVYTQSDRYEVDMWEKRDEESAYRVYLQGVKRILYRGDEEARKEINRVLNSLHEGRDCATAIYSVYIEGIISELEREDPKKWSDYSYGDFKKDFNSVVNATMKGKEMEGWRQLDEESKHKNLFFQYAYVADKEVSGSQIAKKREKVDIITRRIGDTMHFGDEIYCDEEGLRILLYAYYRGYIGDIDKVMTRFCYHNGENKRIYYTKEQILGPIKKRMNSENPKQDFLDKIAEESKKE